MKQIVLHALGVDKSQIERGESKRQSQQQELRKDLPHQQHAKTATPKTKLASQCLGNSTDSNISPSSNTASVHNSDHRQVTKAMHYHSPEGPTRTPVAKMIQQAPTPTSLASSGIGSLNEEDATVSHSYKPVPHHCNTGVTSLKRSNTTEHHNEHGVSPIMIKQHPHRHKRTHSERNMLLHEGKDVVRMQHSMSDHRQLKNEVQRLKLNVEEEEIRYIVHSNTLTKCYYRSMHILIIHSNLCDPVMRKQGLCTHKSRP